jgi:hypothetical protein
MPGADNVIVEARTALLDAIAALEAHKASVILIGAQAIYLRTGKATFALAEATKDSDLAIDTRELGEDPLLEEAMTSAGFILNPVSQQPGAWMSPNGIPVDLMVPEHLAGSGSRRGVRIPPHSKHAARRAAGLEAALIDQSPMTVGSLNGDGRSAVINVAGSAALLVAKLHELGERGRHSRPSQRQGRARHLPTAGGYRDSRSRQDHAAPPCRRSRARGHNTGAGLPGATLRNRRRPRCHDGRSRRGRSRPARHGFGFGQPPRAGPTLSLDVIGHGAPAPNQED